ncbi:hypothetical protein [Candidatus Enterococcus murrayae]|uniref:Polysaccharide biosynthesis protein C-terminal domain-containing protein n=1 Tax=Candidatus Enterococcus murrayae TaxID=2815321 RepID=A0ABS3HM55_9ENTE|nr:hypothetical protein [Enterococcus sp. MJM16]MBO0454019.1 hypothetical protein [Enterococcus sp. MJM16]
MYKKIALRNISTALIWQVATMISGLILPGLIINHYGSEINGVVVSITSFLSYITLLDSGMGGVVKAEIYSPLAQQDWKKVSAILVNARHFFRKIAYVFLVYSICLSVVFPKITDTSIDAKTLFFLTLILSLSLFAEYYSGLVNRLLILADKKHAFYNILQSMIVIMNLIVSMIMIYGHRSIVEMKLFSALVFLLNPFILSYYVRKKYEIDYHVKSETDFLKQKWDGLGHHIANMSRNTIDIFLLTIFFSAKEVSVYSVYMMILNILSKLLSIFINGSESFFGELLSTNQMERLKKYFSFYQFWYTAAVFIFMTTTIEVITVFLEIYVRQAASRGYLNPSFMVLITVAQLVYFIRLPFMNLIFANGRYKETKRYAFVEVGINILCSAIFLRFWGMAGLALGTLLGSIYHLVKVIVFFERFYFKGLWRKQLLQFILYTIVGGLSIVIVSRFMIHTDQLHIWFVLALIVFIFNSLLFIALSFCFFPQDKKKLFNLCFNRSFRVKKGTRHD